MHLKRYKKFSEVFYLVVLSLTIPFYFALYGASGHEYRPEAGDVVWMKVVIVAIISMVFYLIGRRFQGIAPTLIKIVFGLTLICTFYGGLKVLWYILNFDFGNDSEILVLFLSYAIPI